MILYLKNKELWLQTEELKRDQESHKSVDFILEGPFGVGELWRNNHWVFCHLFICEMAQSCLAPVGPNASLLLGVPRLENTTFSVDLIKY
jgi:hypothetical protein